MRQKLSNMRRPLTGEKRDREELDKDDQRTPKKSKPSGVRAGSTIDTPCTDQESSNQESYDANVRKLHAELELEKSNRKTVRKLMKATFPQRRAWIAAEDAPMVPAIIEQFPCLNASKYVSVVL